MVKMQRIFKNKRGLSLIEVLIALGLMGMVAVTIILSMRISLSGTAIADEHTTAESLARAQLEAIENADYDFTAPYEYDTIDLSDFPGYTIEDITSEVGNPNVELINPLTGEQSTLDLGMQKVTVKVSKNDRLPPSSPLILQVETYKK